MSRYKLEIEYIGEGYNGSQIQGEIIDGKRNIEVPTIQNEVEKALRTLTKQNTKIIFSGRTDAGVNAKGQVAHFDTNEVFDETFVASKFINSLNGLLPDDISVKNAEKVSNHFHAQKSAKWRWYRYSVTNRAQRSAFDRFTFLVRNQLSPENINRALSFLEGEHDFSSFKSSGSTTPDNVCKIFLAQAKKLDDKIIIDIVGTRFLYNMVRTIVGTILMFEKNETNPAEIKNILSAKNRKIAGPAISPDGLTLMKVSYEDWTEDTKKKITNGDKLV